MNAARLRPSSSRATARGLLALLALALLVIPFTACRSPNRGVWEGTFDGSVSGVVEFRINARGTRLTGSMEGETRDNQPFSAEMEGKIRDQYFYATFEGRSRAGALPVAFEGLMTGELREGEADGDWKCTIRATGMELAGNWTVRQVAAP